MKTRRQLKAIFKTWTFDSAISVHYSTKLPLETMVTDVDF